MFVTRCLREDTRCPATYSEHRSNIELSTKRDVTKRPENAHFSRNAFLKYMYIHSSILIETSKKILINVGTPVLIRSCIDMINDNADATGVYIRYTCGI